MPEKTTSIVKIAGVDYTIVSDESPEYIQRVGLHVDRAIRDVLAKNRRLSTAMASLLASINIADELLKARDLGQRQGQELLQARAELSRLMAERENGARKIAELEQEMQRLKIELADCKGRLAK